MKFTIATFNVRGLTQEYKQDQLSRDVNKYKLDICSIQETKITEDMDKNIQKNRLICFATGKNKSHGNGFLVSKKWADSVNRYWKVSDRICVLELLTAKSKKRENGTTRYRTEFQGTNIMKQTMKKDTAADHTIIVINVYAPTSDVAKKNKNELKTMYGQLNKLLTYLPEEIIDQSHHYHRRF